jgi:hypothetical protein
MITFIVGGALIVLVCAAVKWVVIPLCDAPEGAHHAPRPRRAGAARAALRAARTVRGLPGAIKNLGPGAGETTSPVTTATCSAACIPVKVDSPAPVTWTRKAIARRIQALRVLRATIRRRFEPRLNAEDQITLAVMHQMRAEDTGGLLALPTPGTTVKLAPSDTAAAIAAIGGTGLDSDTGWWSLDPKVGA